MARAGARGWLARLWSRLTSRRRDVEEDIGRVLFTARGGPPTAAGPAAEVRSTSDGGDGGDGDDVADGGDATDGGGARGPAAGGPPPPPVPPAGEVAASGGAAAVDEGPPPAPKAADAADAADAAEPPGRVEPPVPPAGEQVGPHVTIHHRRLERAVPPLDLSPSEAVRLAEGGPDALRRRELPPDATPGGSEERG